MKRSFNLSLTRSVHVDKFVNDGSEGGKTGRSNGLKKLIVLAIEILDDGVGRTYPELVENSSAKELGNLSKKYTSKEAEPFTDKWRGYTAFKKEFLKVKQVGSEDGKNFKEVCVHMMNIKGWLRVICLHFSK
jgi:hypothetical protein